MTDTPQPLRPGDRVWTDHGLGAFVDYVPGESATTLALVHLDKPRDGKQCELLDPATVVRCSVKREAAD